MGKCMQNSPEMEGEAKAQRPQRRFWRRIRNMRDWQLTLLTFFLFLTVWVLCNILLPRTITSLGRMGVSIYMACWANTTKAKATCVRKSPRSSSGTGPMGEQPRPRAAPGSAAAPGQESPSQLEPWKGEEDSAESARSGQGTPQQGELQRSSCDGEVASARELPQEPQDEGSCGRSRAESSSELPSNRHSIGNMEELSRSLMDSLDIISICYDLMEELKETCRNSKTPALHKSKSREYLVCLQCRRCLTSSCPHCSQPGEQQDLAVLVVILHRLDMMMIKGNLVEMDLELKFELLIHGELVYTWEKMQVLPEAATEMSCMYCDQSLSTSLWGSKCSKDLQPVLRTPEGQTGLGKEDTRAAPDLQPAGQGESLPSAVFLYPQPPWAQPPSPAALQQLRRARLKPLPLVGFKDLGPAFSLQQRIQHSCDPVEWEQMVRLDLQRRADMLARTAEVVV